METQLHKLIYCSRNRVHGNEADLAASLQSILASSRKNNPRLGITGALLYNAGNFAQVLEGPLPSIERVFEVIQRDPRHSEVTVIHCGATLVRDFPEWAMGFTASSQTETIPIAATAFDLVFAKAIGASEHMLATLKELVVSEEGGILLDAA